MAEDGKERALAAELQKVAGESQLNAALIKLGLMESGEVLLGLAVVQDWKRGGAETFTLIFELKTARQTGRFLLKACTPFSPAVPIPDVLRRWIKRRRALEGEGVLTPRLYGVGEGLLVEAFIPEQLESLAADRWTDSLRAQVLEFARALETLRFVAIGPFSDLMTDGSGVYVVDFGEDLGDPHVASTPRQYVAAALAWLDGLRV